jgi:hypothetical protein
MGAVERISVSAKLLSSMAFVVILESICIGPLGTRLLRFALPASHGSHDIRYIEHHDEAIVILKSLSELASTTAMKRPLLFLWHGC